MHTLLYNCFFGLQPSHISAGNRTTHQHTPPKVKTTATPPVPLRAVPVEIHSPHSKGKHTTPHNSNRLIHASSLQSCATTSVCCIAATARACPASSCFTHPASQSAGETNITTCRHDLASLNTGLPNQFAVCAQGHEDVVENRLVVLLTGLEAATGCHHQKRIPRKHPAQ